MALDDRVQIRIQTEVRDAIKNVEAFREAWVAGTEAYVNSTKEVLRVVNSFSGDRITRQSEEIIRSLTMLGNTQQLTYRENLQINRTLQEGLEKYRLIGREVPPIMRQIYDASGQVIKAHQEQVAAEKAVIKEAETLKKVFSDFAGEDVRAKAARYVQVVKDLGGVSKLTAADQKVVNRILAEASESYKKLGEKVPKDLSAVLGATTRVINTAKAHQAAVKEQTAAQTKFNDTVKAFKGDKVISEANQLAAAVAKVGGAAKLTAKEQAEVNKVVTEAIEKYRRLGQTAPAELRNLAAATTQSHQTTRSLWGDTFRLLTVGVMSGNVAAYALQKTFTAVKDAIVTAVSTAIESLAYLAQRGVEVKRISEAFDRLVLATGHTNESLLRLGREGTRGLVNDLDLMAAANKAMLLGINLSGENFKILTDAAFKLGRAMNLETSRAINDLSVALGRMSPRILDNLGIIIKIKDATTEYASSLGKTVQQLTAEERQYAFVIKSMGLMKTKVEELGEVQLTVQDRITQATVLWQNFRDQIALAVATSPALNHMFNRVVETLDKAFGSNRKDSIQTMIDAINWLAIKTLEFGSFMTYVVEGIAKLWKKFWVDNQVLIALIYADAYKIISLINSIALIGAKIPGQMGDGFRLMAVAMAPVVEKIKKTTTEAVDFAVANQKAYQAITEGAKSAREGLDKLIGEMKELAKVRVTERQITEAQAAAERQLAAGREKLSKAEEKALEKRLKDHQKVLEKIEDIESGVNRVSMAMILSQGIKWDPVPPEDLDRAKEFAKVLEKINKIEQEAHPLPYWTFGQNFGKPKPEELKGFFSPFQVAFEETFTKLPQVLLSAIKGGGDVVKAASTYLGMQFGKYLFEWDSGTNTGGIIGKGISKLAGKIGGGLGKTIGSLAGPLGEMVGGVVGNFVSAGISKLAKAIKGPTEAERIMRDIGKGWGVTLSEGLAKQIEADMKKFGNSNVAASLFNLDKMIAENGGLNSKNYDTWMKRFRDIFSMIDQGKFSVEDAREALDKSFKLFADEMVKSGKVASDKFLELFALNDRFGTQSETMKTFLMEQSGAFASNLVKMFGNVGLKYAGLADKIAEVSKQIKDKIAEGVAEDDEELLALSKEIGELHAQQTKGANEVGAAYERMGRLTLAGYNALRAQGISSVEAIGQMGPALDRIIQLQKDLGLTSENAAVQELINYRNLINANQELVTAAQATNDTLLTLSYIGGLTQEAFTDLEAQAIASVQSMEAAGFSNTQALEQMIPFLQTAIDLEKTKGYEISATTQAYIDQAREAGLLSEQNKTDSQVMRESLGEIRGGLAAIIEALGGEVPASLRVVSDAAATAARKAKDSLDTIGGAASDVVNDLDQLDWEAYAERGGIAGSDTEAAIADLENQIASAANKLDKTDWSGWAKKLVEAAEDAEDAIHGLEYGHSPGGIKDIPILLKKSQDATQIFAKNFVSRMTQAKSAVDAIDGMAISGTVDYGLAGGAGGRVSGAFDNASLVLDLTTLTEMDGEKVARSQTVQSYRLKQLYGAT